MAASTSLSVRLAAVALLLALSVATPFVADWLTGLFLGSVPRYALLTPETSVRYKTVEFDIIAHANRFGFRGDESTIRTGQIVAIGNSFTFGWGNNLRDTWEKVLARKLAENGKPMEVYNLGRPGTDLQAYFNTAQTYIPLLKPRLTIVALLHRSDIAQLIERGTLTPGNELFVQAGSVAATEHQFSTYITTPAVSRYLPQSLAPRPS